jgi:hypothetical protein
VLANHVPLLGGAAAAATSGLAGRTGVQGLGGFLADMGSSGLDAALRETGLADLVGRDRFDIVDGLVTQLAGPGDELDSNAARDAMCEVLDDLFTDADSWAELDDPALRIDEQQIVTLLEKFLAHYIYNRVPVIAERLGRITDPETARKADREFRLMIEGCVKLELMAIDPLRVDWRGPEGRSIADQAMQSAYIWLESGAPEAQQ